ncbi:MAG: nucleotide sugar dehydrogenase [Candidatus Diapherotrites archaeon]|nr:nucleotide sugar dehydrogenase [Candidatus Diapherotrites archaeon]
MNKKDFVVCVAGLGYVGLPLALALSKHFKVAGFDINNKRITELSGGIDRNGETLGEELKDATVLFTSDEKEIKKCNFIIVAVPTPVTEAKKPDFSLLEGASKIVGRNLSKGSIVVFESTVYPGATEEVCVPIIEKESGLKCGAGWKVGYSPERVNPGDLEHTMERIIKIVSGMDKKSLERIDFVYSHVTKTFRVSSIKVAEAAKVIENTQRDLNIALVNELSLIFKKIGIDTLEVLEAAGTKWNFLPFKPGLVGGHCIGVDPYYLTYKAEELGYHPQVILAGRRINDCMPFEVVRLAMEGLNKNSKVMRGAKVLVLGATFKEDVRDIRNSRVEDIIMELERLGAEVILNDPLFDEVRFEHMRKKIVPLEKIKPKSVDAVIIAVAHKEYLKLPFKKIAGWVCGKPPVIVDVKGILKTKKVYRL